MRYSTVWYAYECTDTALQTLLLQALYTAVRYSYSLLPTVLEHTHYETNAIFPLRCMNTVSHTVFAYGLTVFGVTTGVLAVDLIALNAI
jgi:hypothetical protein